MSTPPHPGKGLEWIVDARGCTPRALQDSGTLEQVFLRAVEELGLHPLRAPQFHTFPFPGGVTGILMLTESHLTCHSFPEDGYVAFNLYCCRPRPDWPWEERLREMLGADQVLVRRMERPG